MADGAYKKKLKVCHYHSNSYKELLVAINEYKILSLLVLLLAAVFG